MRDGLGRGERARRLAERQGERSHLRQRRSAATQLADGTQLIHAPAGRLAELLQQLLAFYLTLSPVAICWLVIEDGPITLTSLAAQVVWYTLSLLIIIAGAYGQAWWWISAGNTITIHPTGELTVRTRLYKVRAISPAQIRYLTVVVAPPSTRWPALHPLTSWWGCWIRLHRRPLPLLVRVLICDGEQERPTAWLREYAHVHDIPFAER